MKKWIYLIFLIFSITVNAQPPEGTKNNVITNSVENTQTISVQEGITTSSDSEVQSMVDFFSIYTQANSLPYQKNPTFEQQNQMDSYVQQRKKEDVNGFDFHLSAFMAGNYDVTKKEHLAKAKAIQPDNQQVLIQSIGLAFILEDDKTLISDLNKLKQQQKWNEDEFVYAKNLLKSVDQNSILITHGINDTYPLLYLQKAENYRTDVQIIGMHLLQSEAYRKLLETKKLSLNKNQLINQQYLLNFCKLNKAKNIYLSLTIPKAYFEEMEQSLYPVGLTFRYSDIGFENSGSNLNLIEELRKTAFYQAKSTIGKQLSANYLPMLVVAENYYKNQNDPKKQTEIRNIIQQIGNNIGKKDLIEALELDK